MKKFFLLLAPMESKFKLPVRAATTAHLEAAYASKVLCALANGTLSLDSVDLAEGQRVLLKDQVAASQNGIYVVTSPGFASAPWVLTRSSDFDESAKIYAGVKVHVNEGATQEKVTFTLATDDPITLDETPLSFIADPQFFSTVRTYVTTLVPGTMAPVTVKHKLNTTNVSVEVTGESDVETMNLNAACDSTDTVVLGFKNPLAEALTVMVSAAAAGPHARLVGQHKQGQPSAEDHVTRLGDTRALYMTQALFETYEDPPRSGFYPLLAGMSCVILDNAPEPSPPPVTERFRIVSMVPDYAAMETNLLAFPASDIDIVPYEISQTIDREGFITVRSTLSIAFRPDIIGYYTADIRINGQTVSTHQVSSDSGEYRCMTNGVFPVSRGDKVTFFATASDAIMKAATTDASFRSFFSIYLNISFIPPIFVTEQAPSAVISSASYWEEDVATGKTWIDGRDIYRRTIVYDSIDTAWAPGSSKEILTDAAYISELLRAQVKADNYVDNSMAVYLSGGNVLLTNNFLTRGPGTFYVTIWYVMSYANGLGDQIRPEGPLVQGRPRVDLGVPSQVDGPLRDPPLILGMAEVNETLVPALPQGKDHGDGQTYPRPGQAEEGDDGVMSADEKMAFFEAIPELKPEVKPRSDGMERNDSDPLVNAKKKHGVFKEKHKVEGNLRQNEEESNKLAERQRNRKKRQRNCEERQRILMKRQRKLEKLTEVSIDIIYFLIAHRTDKRQKEHEKDMHMVSDINFKTNLLWKLFLALLLPIIAALSFKAMQLLQGILNKFFGN